MQNDLIGGGSFIRNCWYVAGRSSDFGRNLTAVRLLGEDIVIFRGERDEPIALEDACPHRKLPLSCGQLHGSTVVCGYHGLTFDCTGACVAAPTQPESIPKRATVRSYPIEDCWGFLWIWMGDAAGADAGAIIDIPNFDNPQWGRTLLGAMPMACNYLYITDNLLDPSHVAWVHLTSFAGAGTDNRPLELKESDDHVTISRWIPDEPPAPYYAPLLSFGPNCDRKQHYECRIPSTAINMSVYAPVGTGGQDRDLPEEAFINISYNFITPMDEENSLYFWFQHRNQHAGDRSIDTHMFEGATMAFTEDKKVLEKVQTGMTGRRGPYLNLGLDAGAIRFRQKVARRVKTEGATLEGAA